MRRTQSPLIFMHNKDIDTPLFVVGDIQSGIQIATASQHGAGLDAGEVSQLILWLSRWIEDYANDPQCRAFDPENGARCSYGKHDETTVHDFSPPQTCEG